MFAVLVLLNLLSVPLLVIVELFTHDLLISKPMSINLHPPVDNAYLVPNILSCLDFISSEHPKLYSGLSDGTNSLCALVLQLIFNRCTPNEIHIGFNFLIEFC